MILWDLAGEDNLSHVRPAYLQGASACIFVADGGRPQTLEIVVALRDALRPRKEMLASKKSL